MSSPGLNGEIGFVPSFTTEAAAFASYLLDDQASRRRSPFSISTPKRGRRFRQALEEAR